MWAFKHYGRDLPDHSMLADYEPPPLDGAVRDELDAFVTRRRSELGD